MATAATQAIEVKVDRIFRLNGEGSVKAFCDVRIGDALLVKGIRVVQGKKGLFASMPREADKEGAWYDIVHPLTKTMHAELQRVVLAAYEAGDQQSARHKTQDTRHMTQGPASGE